KGLSDSIDKIAADPAGSAQTVSTGIDKATGKALDVSLVTKSLKSIQFTLDPLASTLKTDVDHAESLGILKSTPLTNIFDLTLLNKFLTSEGKPTVSGT